MEREFEAGSKFGKSIILQETKDKSYSLIFAIKANEFLVAERLDPKKGTWLSGNYFGTNIQDALEFFNSRNKIGEKEVKKLKYVGTDDWDRPVYKDDQNNIYKDIDLGKPGSPVHLCSVVDNKFDGEPYYDVKFNFIIDKSKKEMER